MNELKNAGKTNTLPMDYNIAALLCYLPVAFVNVGFSILWLATEPKANRIVRFHALQGLFLAGAALIVGMIISALSVVLIPLGAWQVLNGLYTLDSLVFLVGSIVGMVNAYNGIEYKLPYLGEIVEKQLG